MNLNLKAYSGHSELIFELSFVSKIAIGVSFNRLCETGEVTGDVSLDGNQTIYPEEFKLLSKVERISMQLHGESSVSLSSLTFIENVSGSLYADSLGGRFDERAKSGRLIIAVGLTKIEDQTMFDSSIVLLKDKKSTLLFDQFIEELNDPFVHVGLDFCKT